MAAIAAAVRATLAAQPIPTASPAAPAPPIPAATVALASIATMVSPAIGAYADKTCCCWGSGRRRRDICRPS